MEGNEKDTEKEGKEKEGESSLLLTHLRETQTEARQTTLKFKQQ